MAEDPRRREREEAERLIHQFEVALLHAVLLAFTQWLVELRRLVLPQVPAGRAPRMPDTGRLSEAELQWRRAINDLVRPKIEELFGEAFQAQARTAVVSDLPYRLDYIERVHSRLKLFPSEQFEMIRMEIAEAIDNGETIPQIRDRIAAQLDFDSTRGANGEQADTRAVQGRIDEIERRLDRHERADADSPDRLSQREERRLRGERGRLYDELYRLKAGWEWKAERIARTEAIGALNGGTYAAALFNEAETGETFWKEWLATTDERTRPSHRHADGQIRPLRESFNVGHADLAFPGDPTGPAEEVINCRCTLLTLDAFELDAMGVDPHDLPDGGRQDADDGGVQGGAGPSAATAPDQGETMTRTSTARRPGPRAGAFTDAGTDTEAAALPDGWRGVLAPLDAQSGDGRIIATPAQLRVREAPRALLWQRDLEMGHGGATVAGRIDRAWIVDGRLMGEGAFDLGSEAGREAARQLGEGWSNGISVDLDDMTMVEAWYSADGERIPDDVLETADWDELWEAGARPVMIAEDWRLMTATLVSQPAFDEARVEPVFGYEPTGDAEGDGGEMAARSRASGGAFAVTAATDLPIADRDQAWDGDAAIGRVFDLYTDEDGEVDTTAVARAFLWRDDDADPATQGAYSLPIADVIGDELQLVPAAVAAAAGGHGVEAVDGLSDDERSAIEDRICDLYAKIRGEYDDWPACPFDDEDEDEGEGDDEGDGEMAARTSAGSRVMRAVITAGGAPQYAAADFADPGFRAPTPLTVGDDGRVRGHLATWGTCHTSFPDVCVTPPRSQTGYAWFHVGEVITDAGPLPVGKVTLGTGHADSRAGARPAAAHYDDTGTCVAVVRAGEDDHGIWVAGHLVGDVTDEQIATLRRSPLSGDWRRVNGSLELVAALAVNVPGFPVPRAMAASGAAGQQLSLTAAGVVPQPGPRRRAGGGVELDYALLARMIADENLRAAARLRRSEALARQIGRDRMSRIAQLTARIGAGRGSGT
jgi:hypothetical protein